MSTTSCCAYSWISVSHAWWDGANRQVKENLTLEPYITVEEEQEPGNGYSIYKLKMFLKRNKYELLYKKRLTARICSDCMFTWRDRNYSWQHLNHPFTVIEPLISPDSCWNNVPHLSTKFNCIHTEMDFWLAADQSTFTLLDLSDSGFHRGVCDGGIGGHLKPKALIHSPTRQYLCNILQCLL